jgi:biopolymer transport protein ExbB/TolQ
MIDSDKTSPISQSKQILIPNVVSISRSKDPLIIWIRHASIMLLVLFATLSKSLLNGLSADSSHFSAVIAAVFICAFAYSYIEARRLRREWIGTNRINSTLKTSQDPNSRAEELAIAIVNHVRPDTLRIKDLVDSYYSAMEVPLRTLSVISGLMVTLGLIGTILGLIVSIGGLEDLMSQVEGINKGILGGVKETIRGMAIAFYSTLLGAVLGAVILRMLSVSLTNSLVQMSCGLFEYLELLPKSNETRILQPLLAAELQFFEFAKAVASARNELQRFTSATLDSHLASISAQLETCANALKEARR